LQRCSMVRSSMSSLTPREVLARTRSGSVRAVIFRVSVIACFLFPYRLTASGRQRLRSVEIRLLAVMIVDGRRASAIGQHLHIALCVPRRRIKRVLIKTGGDRRFIGAQCEGIWRNGVTGVGTGCKDHKRD